MQQVRHGDAAATATGAELSEKDAQTDYSSGVIRFCLQCRKEI